MDHPSDKLFQVSVKGLFLNEEGKVMMLQEADGNWDFVGGRIEKGENLVECLKRESLEEIGVGCEVLERQPSIVYATTDQDGFPRIMVFYKVWFDNLDFVPSDECVGIGFFSKEEIAQLKTIPQVLGLIEYL